MRRHVAILLGFSLALSGCERGPTDSSQPVPRALPSSISTAEPAMALLIEKDSRIVLVDGDLTPTDEPIRLAGPPTDIAVSGSTLVVAFSTGDIATRDLRTGAQAGRAVVERLRLPQPVVELLVDQVVARGDRLLVAMRVATKVGDAYRGVVEERSLPDLGLLNTHVLPSGIVQDITHEPSGATLLLLDDGRVVDLQGRARTPSLLGTPTKLMASGTEGLWFASSGDSQRLQTPLGALVALPDGAGPTSLVPDPAGGSATLVLGDLGQVWKVMSDGTVQRRVEVPDLPYAAAQIGGAIFVGAANSDVLTRIARDGTVVRQRIAHGVIRIEPLS